MKERCERYGIISSGSISLPAFTNTDQDSNGYLMTPQQQQYFAILQQNFLLSLQADSPSSSLALQNRVEELETKIEDLEDEKTDLQKQLFHLEVAKDQTPAALIFYTAMADQHLIPTFQQLLLQLNHLKKFTNANEHMDFITLQRRLQVCLTAIPSIDRFIHKYEVLHQSWLHHRFRLFSQRGLNGGDADSSNFCPICHTSNTDMMRLTAITATTTTVHAPLTHNPDTLRAKSRLQSRMKPYKVNNRPNTSFSPSHERALGESI
jgi:cell division septum initiation protein DivIVA